MLRRLAILLLTVLSVTAYAGNKESDPGFRVDAWKYDAQVHADNTWDVTETLTVTFTEQRHGIYRYIPQAYERHHGLNGKDAKYSYHIGIDSIAIDGFEFMTESKDDDQDNFVIRIGDENILVSGKQTYVIRYRLTYPDDRYTVSDELLHTVLGADCPTTIGDFRFNIRFDNKLPASFASLLHVYSGEWGTDGNALNVTVTTTPTSVSGHLTSIPPMNAITLQAELPEGFWVAPYSVSRMPNYIAMALALIFFILAMSYLLFHRRQKPLTVIEYNAPDGISSAEVGVIIDGEADLSDLTSLVVWWASKGYLKIREVPKEKSKDNDIELIMVKNLLKDAPKYQQKFWSVFFDGRDKVKLSNLGKQHKKINNALLALSRHFSGDRKLVSIHWKSLLCSILAIVCGCISIATSSCVDVLDTMPSIFAIAIWLLPLSVTILLRVCLSNYDMITKTRWRLTQYATIILIGGAEILIYWMFFYEVHDSFLTFTELASVIGGGWLIALFSGRMQRDTEYRLRQMSLILGFKEFIEKSELPMLKAQVDENPTYFFDVLPYAMVFGLTKKWQKQFQDISMECPDWYEPSGNIRNLTAIMVAQQLTTGINHTITNVIEVSSHDPGTSGGHIGGFAGAGGGGGGVGSW